MGELFGDPVKIDQDFLESLVVGALELVKTVGERICDVLQLLNLSPLFEFQISS